MNAERARELLLRLPHVIEAEQFGGLIYWVGDKAIGGRTCAMLNLETVAGDTAIMLPVGAERFSELCEIDGMIPAPYMARNFWIAAERWNALRDSEWEEQLRASHALTFDKLLRKTKAILAMPKAEQKRVIAGRRRTLAAKAAAKTR